MRSERVLGFSSPSGEERIETEVLAVHRIPRLGFSSPSGEERIETPNLLLVGMIFGRFSSPSGEERIETPCEADDDLMIMFLLTFG